MENLTTGLVLILGKDQNTRRKIYLEGEILIPKNLANTVGTLSQDRIRSYKSYFGLTSDQEAFGLYLWNDQLSAAFFKIISILEVTLRNAFHRELSRHYNLYRSQGSAFDNDWYEHLINTNIITDRKTIDQIRDVTHKRKRGSLTAKPGIKPGDVIAQQTFGFWQNLIEKNNRIPWQAILFLALKDHFRKHQSYWDQAAIDDLVIRLLEANNLRNRIAHHEPIWKFKGKKHYKTQKQIYLAATTPTDSINQMRVLNDRLVRLLGWFSEDRKNDYLSSHYKRHFDWLARRETIEIYKSLKPLESTPMSVAKRNLRKVLSNQQLVEVAYKDHFAMIVVGPL